MSRRGGVRAAMLAALFAAAPTGAMAGMPHEDPSSLPTPANVLYIPDDGTQARPEALDHLMNATSGEDDSRNSQMPDLRKKAFISAARSAGAQAGLYWRAHELEKQLMKMRPFLDRIYNAALQAVLIQHKNYYIVPPVISGSAGGMRKNDSGRVLRIAEQTFRIERAPYFVVNPPTWRDYLTLSVPAPSSHHVLLPSSSAERAVWKKGVKEGWKSGVRQADMLLRTRLARMTRDIVGMVRYHILESRHMVSKPLVTERYYPVSGGGKQMSIQDSIIRIKSDPALNANRDAWRPLPQLPDTRYLFPSAYRHQRGTTQ